MLGTSTPMPGLHGYAAFVFDLDGTLVDSAPDIGDALGAVLREDGRRALSLDEVRGLIGDGVAVLLQRAWAVTGAPLDPSRLADRVGHFLASYAAGGHVGTRPYPGAIEALRSLRARGVRLAICTNKPIGLTHQLLDVLAVADLFDAVTGGDSLPVRKPHPDHLLGTLDLLDARPGEAIMIGDSANDVAVARAAGVAVAVVPWGYTRTPAAELGADRVIASFDELASW